MLIVTFRPSTFNSKDVEQSHADTGGSTRSSGSKGQNDDRILKATKLLYCSKDYMHLHPGHITTPRTFMDKTVLS